VAPRATILSLESHDRMHQAWPKARLIHLTTHASWLNQAEPRANQPVSTTTGNSKRKWYVARSAGMLPW
jgi:hypothetical protein